MSRKKVIEHILLFIPSILALIFRLLRKKKHTRLFHSGETLIIFPKDKVLAYLCRGFLDWWVQAYHVPVSVVNFSIANHPAIKRELFFEKNYFSFLWELIKNRFRTIVFLEPQRYRFLSFLAWLAHIRNRIGFTLQDQNPFLTFRYAFHEGTGHYIHQLRSFFEELTGHKADILPLLEKKPPDEALRKALKLITELGVGRFVVLIPGQLWPKERYAEFISQISITVLLLALDDETYQKNQEILKIAKEGFLAKNEIFLLPVVDKELLAALSSRSEFVFAEDSLAAHYAVSAGARALTLFGPRNEKLFAPFSNRSTAFFVNISCRPCYSIQEDFFCKNTELFACMKQISVEMVLQKCQELLEKGRQKPTGKGSF